MQWNLLASYIDSPYSRWCVGPWYLVGRNSSVGRALDWRSKGPWFNPGFRHCRNTRRSTHLLTLSCSTHWGGYVSLQIQLSVIYVIVDVLGLFWMLPIKTESSVHQLISVTGHCMVWVLALPMHWLAQTQCLACARLNPTSSKPSFSYPR